ncbi:Calcineurin-like phosphoesterase superfamily domain protein [Candidatus Bilamarchaeum dharawalense]|uniref:Calcineurin-like phosphoesterase superfamily domain protein n=1 Tax=Candidatus Bilamarchaeum dharawalense TaxID=2885759 RepID=A0A5E4LSH3_9ARCH|nr:Calcineurin-like phosphoesterase superfamily domain protein [Candidatus Bilamarchaeum dharawalense]
MAGCKIEVMKILYNAPAILHKGALIVGDTHFGMEWKLRQRGVYDEQFSTRLFSKLKELIVDHKVKTLILLGDVKEDITMLDRTTEEILAKLSMLCKVIIVRGNHDGGIDAINSGSLERRAVQGHGGNAEVKAASGFVYEKLGLIHGHSWPAEELMGCSHLIMGHQHPMISITDAFGKKRSEPVWVVAKPDVEVIKKRYGKFNKKIKLILMPAFNPVIGTPINIDDKTKFGPLINNKLFKLNDALVFRLNGICLGKLK